MTGDAVVLDIEVAQLPVRALGALIDLMIILVGYAVAILLWAVALPEFDEALTAAILIIFTVTVIVGYPLAMETATRGRSVGKMVMGLRVVSDDGGPERFRQALFRALAITHLVTKDSGGEETRAKLDAAAALGLPVIMVDRPPPLPGQVADVQAALNWLEGACPRA